MSLQQKVIVITGAGSGIGQATAVAVARSGNYPVLLGRDPGALKETKAKCKHLGPAVVDIPTDVTKHAAVCHAVETILDHFGRIDGLVNNAGVARFGPLDGLPLAEMEVMLNVNFWGPVLLIRAALPSLRQSRGAIVNVTSVGGLISMPGRSIYGATKAALNHLTRSLARELAPDVRVNAVLPGPIDTPMYDRLDVSPREVDDLKQTLLDATPMKRFGRADEIAKWIFHLLGDSGEWVTGTLLTVDGGRSC